MRRTKYAIRITRWGVAIIVFSVLTVINVLIFRVLNENNTLVSRNEGERAINDLIALFRDIRPEDFEEAREAYETYSTGIIGLGAYDREGDAVFYWGTAPETMTTPENVSGDPRPRVYTPNRDRESLVILQNAPPRRRGFRPPAEEPPASDRGDRTDLLTLFFRGAAFYWEVHQPVYWRLTRLYLFLFPFTEVILAGLIVFITLTLEKNRQYRARIEEQKNLVVLGTAAGTLAHEIKNPLSSMKLQAGILERTVGDKAKREIAVLNEEIDRLSVLTFHVNDYLRDPLGNPEVLDAAEAVKESVRRVLGDNHHVGLPKSDGTICIRFDRERFRSVMENILLNAQQSGGDTQDIEIGIARENGSVRIDVLDRGTGIPEEVLSRIFDPFYTTRSSGTGIGLSIVKRFLQAAEGTFTIANRENGGAVGTITIPELKV